VLTILWPRKQQPLRIPGPFMLCGAGVLYGFVVALLRHPTVETGYALLNWGCPLIFGIHLCTMWRRYPAVEKVITSTYVWGVGLMGAYGIFQYIVAPAWDTYWLVNVSQGLIDPSFGQPAPYALRVWSTLNSAGPFANVMVAGLLLLFVTKSKGKLPISIAGYASFLLSVVRTCWLSWFLGLMLILRGARPKTILKVVGSIALLAICLIPIIEKPEIAPVLGDRLATFRDLGQDESFRERSEMYKVIAKMVAEDPFGHGIRNQEIVNNIVVDSGIMVVLLSLGWMGSALYTFGILSFLLSKRRSPDIFPKVTKAICITYLSQLIGGIVFVGVTGAMFWMFVALTLSAEQWYAAETDATAKAIDRSPQPMQSTSLSAPVAA
jgi:hypothetical protein